MYCNDILHLDYEPALCILGKLQNSLRGPHQPLHKWPFVKTVKEYTQTCTCS